MCRRLPTFHVNDALPAALVVSVAVLLVGLFLLLLALTAATGFPALGLVAAALLLTSPLLIVLLRHALQSRVGARTPAECWGWEGPPEDTPADPWPDERFGPAAVASAPSDQVE